MFYPKIINRVSLNPWIENTISKHWLFHLSTIKQGKEKKNADTKVTIAQYHNDGMYKFRAM